MNGERNIEIELCDLIEENKELKLQLKEIQRQIKNNDYEIRIRKNKLSK